MEETDRAHAISARGAPATDATIDAKADAEEVELNTLQQSRSASSDEDDSDDVKKAKMDAQRGAHDRVTLDTGETRLHIREHWWQLWSVPQLSLSRFGS
jgi:hypothetical protein